MFELLNYFENDCENTVCQLYQISIVCGDINVLITCECKLPKAYIYFRVFPPAEQIGCNLKYDFISTNFLFITGK